MHASFAGSGGQVPDILVHGPVNLDGRGFTWSKRAVTGWLDLGVQLTSLGIELSGSL